MVTTCGTHKHCASVRRPGERILPSSTEGTTVIIRTGIQSLLLLLLLPTGPFLIQPPFAIQHTLNRAYQGAYTVVTACR